MDMSFLNSTIADSPELSLLAALIIGIAFGFVLERAGFGRSTKLAAQFYLRDMTVFKVMFTAIVVATLGLGLLGGLNLVDVQVLSQSAASYTFVGPFLVGGLLLGVGFVVSGYCPGTSVVATASGNLDGLVTLLGVVLGSLLFGEAYPWLADFATGGNLGHVFLPEWLGLPRPVVVLLVTAMAVGGFIGVEKIERLLSRREGSDAAPPVAVRAASAYGTRRTVSLTLAGVAAIGLATLAVPAPAAPDEGREPLSISPEDLAHRLMTEPWSLRVIDTRSPAAWTAKRIPQSESVPADQLDVLGLAFTQDDRDLVLVTNGELRELPPAAAAYGGRVLALEGGYRAWHRFAVDEPRVEGVVRSAEATSALAFRLALHGLVTGQAAAPPPPAPVRRVVARPTGGGGGGCN
jgi:hypothetical protein